MSQELEELFKKYEKEAESGATEAAIGYAILALAIAVRGLWPDNAPQRGTTLE